MLPGVIAVQGCDARMFHWVLVLVPSSAGNGCIVPVPLAPGRAKGLAALRAIAAIAATAGTATTAATAATVATALVFHDPGVFLHNGGAGDVIHVLMRLFQNKNRFLQSYEKKEPV